MRSDRWFWILGILFGAAGIYVGVRWFFDEQWLSFARPGYRARAAAGSLTVIMLALLFFSIRNLIQTFREPKYPDRPY
ncbi:MAG: hypothetical protein HONBIEJF_02700 [Fimbriimonadaceae bacterium]|nr:hypothetical protein [Fimbriimonadaceae bacterium]